jgi:hypothetical protein
MDVLLHTFSTSLCTGWGISGQLYASASFHSFVWKKGWERHRIRISEMKHRKRHVLAACLNRRDASQDIDRYKTGNVTINVTLRRVRINVVAVEEQKEFHNIILSVYL